MVDVVRLVKWNWSRLVSHYHTVSYVVQLRQIYWLTYVLLSVFVYRLKAFAVKFLLLRFLLEVSQHNSLHVLQSDAQIYTLV